MPAPASSSLPRLLYTLFVLALLPWAVLHLLWRARKQPEYLRHWGERFGKFLPRHDGPTLWLHAVSVGETRAAQPLVAALQKNFPQHRIVFSHMTPTGRATSEALFGDSVERVYLPYDTPWGARAFLRHFKPDFGLILETELWPNLIHTCRLEACPLMLINARLSARSASRYAWLPALSRGALQELSGIAAQAEEDAGRLLSLGAQKVEVTGNMKFDIEAPAVQLALAKQFREWFGARPVWLAASTREGEEAPILAEWQAARRSNSTLGDALLVLVPRHPQRFDAVARLIEQQGMEMQRRSENCPIRPGIEVLLGDSMGEMFAWYAASDLAFIGGSLLDFGGQNLIEACAVGTPVLIGRYTRNFAQVAHEAKSCGAAIQVGDAAGLVTQIAALLGDESTRRFMGQAGLGFAARHRGATAHTMSLIETTMISRTKGINGKPVSGQTPVSANQASH